MCRLHLIQGMFPGAFRPVVAHDAFGRPVLGGVQGPEALVEAGGVQRRAQAGGYDAGYVRAVGEQFLEPLARSTLRIAATYGAHSTSP